MVAVKTYSELITKRSELRRQYYETAKQQVEAARFIPEVCRAVLAQLLLEIRTIQLQIEARDSMLGGGHISGEAVQLPFDFLFDCLIADDEIPF